MGKLEDGNGVGQEGFLEEVALWPELRQTLGICQVDTGSGGGDGQP